MNNDAISREALKKKIRKYTEPSSKLSDDFSIGMTECACEILDMIDNAPTVDAIVNTIEVRPQGKWIIIHHKDLLGRWNSWDEYKCSACKHSVSQIYEDAHGEYATKFCPNCGAKMQNGDSE